MKTKTTLYVFFLILHTINSFCQSPPWNNPLRMAWSTDGKTFNTPLLFQDSAGVPSLIKWKGDTLVAAFQWFRQPNPSPTWDRVATKFSYDNGVTWTQPSPIIVNGLPQNYQRPFDPTLAVFSKDSIRIYFSSSKGIPMPGADSTINTYSAKSADGINFYFEPNSRVDEPFNKVIDPAVIYFNSGWHYLAPIGSPQQGAYHYVSPNGLNFSAVSNIPSDNLHNWTGNYMIENSAQLRFYGCGPNIWYNTSTNGGVWSGYVNTNIQGGDPSVVKISGSNYLMVYVGPPLITGIDNLVNDSKTIKVFPNPASTHIKIVTGASSIGSAYTISDNLGHVVLRGKITTEDTTLDVTSLTRGVYLFSIGVNGKQFFKVIKE